VIPPALTVLLVNTLMQLEALPVNHVRLENTLQLLANLAALTVLQALTQTLLKLFHVLNA
jgi:hypothetical protein